MHPKCTFWLTKMYAAAALQLTFSWLEGTRAVVFRCLLVDHKGVRSHIGGDLRSVKVTLQVASCSLFWSSGDDIQIILATAARNCRVPAGAVSTVA